MEDVLLGLLQLYIFLSLGLQSRFDSFPKIEIPVLYVFCHLFR